jgi:ABC-2 type transport system permease protein
MRVVSLFKKTMIENFRDWKIMILTLTFAPFFVILYSFYLGESTLTPYRVVVINHDGGAMGADGKEFNAGEDLIAEMVAAEDPDGTQLFDLEVGSALDSSREQLVDQDVDLVVHIPDGFTQVILAYQAGNEAPPASMKTYGDPANPKYIMAAVWSDMLAYEYTSVMTGTGSPLIIQAETISGVVQLNEFELYIPGLLALALIMLMFTAAASLIKEKDKGTIIRLRLSNMTTLEWLFAVSLTQVIVGMLALGLTYATAVAFGYTSSGSMTALAVVGVLSCLSIIAISLIVSAYLRTIFDLLTIGCFPFFILMFFSGGMFPLPPLQLFTLGERTININDILPTTHSIAAMNKILNHNAGLGDVAYELVAIILLTVIYFAIGVWLFTRRHMQATR